MLKEAVHQHLLPVMDKIITGALSPQLLLVSQFSCLSGDDERCHTSFFTAFYDTWND
jgi:hypothetical protein